MNRVAIIGSGTLGKHIAHYLNNSDSSRVCGFFDDYQQKGVLIDEMPVLGSLADIETSFSENNFDSLVIGIGYDHLAVREKLFSKYSPSIPFHTFIHPSCYTDKSVRIGTGVIALPGCIFDKDVEIGNNIFFNIGCVIAHDSRIYDNCFFGPAVKLAGFVSIQNNCFLGIDTTVINNITVCNKVTTGAGSVVTSNITEPGLYIGTPARKIK